VQPSSTVKKASRASPQHIAKFASGRKDAGIGRLKAGHQIYVRLHAPHYLSHTDLVGRAAKLQPTVVTAHSFDKSGDPELMDHLHQMIF
jgi:hypothetical protein